MKGQKKSDSGKPPFPLYRSQPNFDEGFSNVVKILKDSKRIVVLTGAGISVSCGIPDFRSKEIGLYSNLDAAKLGLSCAEELFDFDFFQENPRPFYQFARNLYFPLGNDERVRPSDAHKLLALLEEKKMLLRVYSQNIDGLEEVAGVSAKKVVYAHGTLNVATCLKCKRKVDAHEIEKNILDGAVAYCQAPLAPSKGFSAPQTTSREPIARARKRQRSDEEFRNLSVCGGIMKPGVTFFGEVLHDNVGRCLEADRDKVDALIVIGTSLSVAPISKVIGYLPPNIPRILINRTIAHPMRQDGTESDDEDEEKDFRSDYVFDAYLLGFCDDVTRALAKKLFESESNKADDDDDDAKKIVDAGKLLATLDEDDEHYSKEDWSSSSVPQERVFLFPGAQAPSSDEDGSVLTYREIAHCDGCSERIVGTVRKCVSCFDFDLCSKCFPTLSKTHYDGKHQFASEDACPLFD